MAYDNNTNKIVFIKRTGQQVLDDGYKIDISSLLDVSATLSSTLSNQDEFVVVRQFANSSVSEFTSAPLTADEAWAAWTLPNTNTSGSSMYTTNTDGTITFSTAASDYSFTTTQSGRGAAIALPVIAAADEIYVMRKTYNLSKFINWATGSKITSANLNMSSDQMMFLNQELLFLYFNMHSISPSVGQANGLCPLTSSGKIASDFIDGSTLGIITSNGVTGDGTTGTPITINLNGDSILQASAGLSVDTQNVLTSTSTSKPLSAAQGKLLKDSIDTLGTGVNYKGAGDMVSNATFYDSIYSSSSPAAGDTVVHTGSGGTAHAASWGALGTIAQYNQIRYSGSAWQIVESASYIKQDGSVALNSAQTAVTQSTADSDTSVATTAFVHAVADSIKLEDLAEVESDTNASAGNMIFWDGDSWEPIALNDTTPGSNKIMTTGDALSEFDDITGTPANGHLLQYNGSNWVSAAVSALTPTETVPAGTADGAANDQSEVQTALQAPGISEIDDATSSSTLRNVNFCGRNHLLSSTALLTQKIGRTYHDGILSLSVNNAVDDYLLENVATIDDNSGAVATTAAIAVGDRSFKCSSSDAATLFVGQHLNIRTDNAAGTQVQAQVYASMSEDHAQDTHYQYTNDAGYVITRISGGGSTRTVYVDTPFTQEQPTGSTVWVFGGDTNNKDVTKDLVFNNMVFEDKLARIFEFNSEGGASSSGSGTPFTTSDGSGDFTFHMPPDGHGYANGAAVRIMDADIRADDGSTGFLDADFDDVNKSDVLDLAGSGPAVCTVTASNAKTATSSVTLGSGAEYAIFSRHNGIALRGAQDVVFRNCTFRGWNRYAVELVACHNVLFDNCKFIDCRGNPNNSTATSGTVESCIFLNGKSISGNKPYTNSNIKIHNCSFINCGTAIAGHEPTKGATVFNTACCKNLEVKDCYFHCEKGIHIRSLVQGQCDITNSVFETVLNENLDHVGITYDAINLEGGCSETRIRDNRIDSNKKLISSSSNFDASDFFGRGKGINFLHQDGGQANAAFATQSVNDNYFRSTWRNGIYLHAYQNWHQIQNTGFNLTDPTSGGYASATALPHTPKSTVQISGNTVAVWGKHAVFIGYSFNNAIQTTVSPAPHQWFSGIRVSNNELKASKRVVMIKHLWGDAGFKSIIDGSEVVNNKIIVDIPAQDFPNNVGYSVGRVWDNYKTYTGGNDVAFTEYSCVALDNGGRSGNCRIMNSQINGNTLYGANYNGYVSGSMLSFNSDYENTTSPTVDFMVAATFVNNQFMYNSIPLGGRVQLEAAYVNTNPAGEEYLQDHYLAVYTRRAFNYGINTGDIAVGGFTSTFTHSFNNYDNARNDATTSWSTSNWNGWNSQL